LLKKSAVSLVKITSQHEAGGRPTSINIDNLLTKLTIKIVTSRHLYLFSDHNYGNI